MSVKKIGKILKVNVPEFMQGMKHLDEYLDVSAEVLGDIRDDIDGLRDMKNYRKSEAGLVDVNLAELGFEVPVNINLSIRREILRDVAQVHLRSGTNDGIVHLLRIIGIDPSLRRGWLLNPHLVDKGKQRELGSPSEENYVADNRAYMDLLYGDTVDKNSGTFFEGYSYWDTNEENPSKNIPIVGEVYDTFDNLGDDVVSATPYLVIRFDADDIFNVDATESVDPDTGEVFPYTVSERFTLLEDIIEFFLVGEYRPTTMRIVVEVRLLEIEEALDVTEDFELKTDKTNEESYSETMLVTDVINKSARMTLPNILIGDDVLIGLPSPIYNRWFAGEYKIGDTQREVWVIEEWERMFTLHHLGPDITTVRVPLLGESHIDTTGLPTHTVTGITDKGVRRAVTKKGIIPSEFHAIEVKLAMAPVGNLTFTIDRVERTKSE